MLNRLENETREEYKARLKFQNEVMDVSFKRHEQYGLDRNGYLETFFTGQLELKAARSQGYTDEQILEALKKGDPSQISYGKFIEQEILKRG